MGKRDPLRIRPETIPKVYNGWKQIRTKFLRKDSKVFKEVLSKVSVDDSLFSNLSEFYQEIGDVPAHCKTSTVAFRDVSKGFVKGNIYWYEGDGHYRLVNGGPPRLSNDAALSRLREVHGDKYGYEKFVYTRADEKVTLFCPKHGEFSMRFCDLISGSGCNKCGIERQTEKLLRTFDDYIEQAKQVHGDKYDYSFASTSIKSGKDKIEIVCRKCGSKFSQRISRHAYGSGCSKCQDYGFCETKDGYIYFLRSSSMVKVGITNRNPTIRLREINKFSPEQFELVEKRRLDGHVCVRAESTLHEALGAFLRKPTEVFSGYTEAFYTDNTELAEGIFKGFVESLPEVGEEPFVPKPEKVKETPAERRQRLSAKTGLPVGVVRKYDRWYFQIITRENGKKDKKPLGSFDELEDCIAFANHYWDTGELLNTNLNRMTHNKYGLPNCITPCSGGYRVQGGLGTRKSQQNFYLGTFKNLEDAINAIETKRRELLNG